MSRRGSVLQDYGPTIPTISQDAQLAAASYYQRDKEQANQLAYQKERDKAQADEQAKKESELDKYRKLKMIDDATNTTPYQNSTQKANSLGTQQLLSIREKFAGKTDLPAEQLYLQLQQDLTPVAQGYNTYKDNLKSMEEMAKEAVKVNPNLDLEKVLVDLQKEVDSEYLTTNPDGTTNFNQARVGTQSDALTRILSPENAWKYSKGTKPLIDAVAGKGQDGELFAKAPDGSQINYKTKIPNWAQLVDQDGNVLEVDPKTGLIPKGKKPTLALKGTTQQYQEVGDDGKPLFDRQGNPVMSKMVVVPKSTMREILSNDATEYAFEGDWQRHKKIGNIQTTPAEEEDLKQVYFSQWLADNGLNQPTVSGITHLPPQPRNTTNIRVGGAPPPVMDIVTPVRDYFENVGEQKEGLKGVAQLNLFNNEVTTPIMTEVKARYPDITADEIYYKKDGDNIWVMKANTLGGDGNPTVNAQKDTPVFKLDDFSNVTGNKPQGQKSKNKALRQAQSGKEKDKAKTFNIINPNTGEVIMKGVDEAAANKAKAKGYKVQ